MKNTPVVATSPSVRRGVCAGGERGAGAEPGGAGARR